MNGEKIENRMEMKTTTEIGIKMKNRIERD